MSEADLQAQVALLRASFHARAARVVATQRPVGSVPPPGASPGESLWLDAARVIAERVAADAVHGSDGSATWIVPDALPDEQSFGVRPMGPTLYSGVSGVAVFLAAASRVLGEPDHGRLARAALHSVRRQLREGTGVPAIGGVMGLGSVAWALGCAGLLLEDGGLVEDARLAATRIDNNAISADTRFDVAGGAAGAILALLALHALTRDDVMLAQAERCAAQLLANRVGSPRTWQTPSGRRLSGFAHGAAGIAHALLALHAVTGDAPLAQAAAEAIRYEGTLFEPGLSNWRDLRPDVPGPGPFCMTAWCNGAAGIGLARLRWQANAATFTADVDAALTATLQHAVLGLDHVCCGTFGRIELLLAAGLGRGDASLIEAARQRAAAALARAGAGHFLLVRDPGCEVSHAGFFRGISGIGYQLLRLARPHALPSVLTLEPLAA
jgi:type 2 lantibiotic biosynthesis protein LanM